MAIGRSDRADNHHLELSLWASAGRAMPKMYFPLNSPTELVVGQDYATYSTTAALDINESEKFAESPTAHIQFSAIGAKSGEITSGTMTIESKTLDAPPRSATFDFAVPTETDD
jgi:hypothetical protein